jgi:hypothetical protein
VRLFISLAEALLDLPTAQEAVDVAAREGE